MTDKPTDAAAVLAELRMAIQAGAKNAELLLSARKALSQQTARAEAIQNVVDEQAEDDGLWFASQTASEAYLQQALRRLHATIEGEAGMLAVLQGAKREDREPFVCPRCDYGIEEWSAWQLKREEKP